MVCKNCGRPLNQGSIYCPGCGALQTNADSENTITPAAPPPRNNYPQFPQQVYQNPFQQNNMQYAQQPPVPASFSKSRTVLFWIGKLAVFIAIICFLLPFYSGSIAFLSDKSNSITGLEMLQKSWEAYNDTKDLSSNVSKGALIVAITLTAAIGFEVLALLTPTGTSLFSFLSAAAHVLFAAMVYASNQKAEESYDYIEIKMEYGLLLAIILLVASIFMMAADRSARKKQTKLMRQY